MSAAACCTTESAKWRIATTPGQSEIWRTPPALYLPLDREFNFTVDVAADASAAKCDRYFDRETDALSVSWAGERVFCNPPYGRQLEKWVEKAFNESVEHEALVVMVLPARTGNRWFHRFVLPHAECRFIQGRLGFELNGPGRRSRAPFDSMVVVFRPGSSGRGTLTRQPTFPFEARA